MKKGRKNNRGSRDARENDPGRENPASRKLGSLGKKMFGAIFAAVFWMGIVGVFLTILAVSCWRQLDAGVRFGRTDGIVVASCVETSDDSDHTTKPVIRYSYSVDGRKYACDRYDFGTISTNGMVAAKIVRQFPPGTRVKVYYDPSDPGSAVLSTAISPTMGFL